MPIVQDLNEYFLQCFIDHYDSIHMEHAEAVDFLNVYCSNPASVKEWINDAVLEMETISDGLKSSILSTIDVDWIWDEIWKSEDISDDHKAMTHLKNKQHHIQYINYVKLHISNKQYNIAPLMSYTEWTKHSNILIDQSRAAMSTKTQ